MGKQILKKIINRLIKFFFISLALEIVLTITVPYFSNSCKSNPKVNKFDIIIVLGSPANTNCKPGQIMRDRVSKGIELFKLGYAKNILFTGGSVKNNCTEAEVMATYAISKGIPRTSIIIEDKAKNTYQNAYYTNIKMKELHFTSAAIVTSKAHTKRSCAAFSEFDIKFTMFGTNNPSQISKLQLILWEFGERMILTHHIIFGYPKNITN